MSKITFSEKQIEVLQRNPYVKHVIDKSSAYTDELKRNFIEEYLHGKFFYTIFKEAGVNIGVIGTKRYERSATVGLNVIMKMVL